MPTTVVSKIGVTNSPVAMDYSTLQAWEDACPANLVTDDKIWEGQCYDQGTFTLSSTGLLISGQTTDATRYVSLKCASGASFKDKAGVRSNALYYNASNGVSVDLSGSGNYTTCIDLWSSYTRVDGLQLKSSGSCATIRAPYVGTGFIVSNCILQSNGWNSSINTAVDFVNCLILQLSTSANWYIHNCNFYGCTIAAPNGNSNEGLPHYGYTTTTVKNTAIFGFATICNNPSRYTGSNNATDLSSIGFGTSNQTSLNFASQFVNSANDFRAVSTGSLDLNGTPDTTYLSTDISGTNRHATTPTIGAWEVTVTATIPYSLIGSGIGTPIIG